MDVAWLTENSEVGSRRTNVTITGSYVTSEGAECEVKFSGPVADAQPVKEFLDPQFRDATEQSLEAEYELKFDAGLPVKGDEIDTLSAKLTKFVSGSAAVEAWTKAKS